jgi:orotate phosphoribosyltransferase
MRSKHDYRLEVRASANPEIVQRIYDESFFPAADLACPGVSRWTVDLRVPLADGRLLAPVSAEMAAVLAGHAIDQVAGAGYGAFLLVGGILAADVGMKGGLIRESRKPHGLRKRVEGALHPDRPVFLVDDILSSGQTALRAALSLREEGFRPVGVLTVLQYGWKEGAGRLRQAGLCAESLATLQRPPFHG